MYDAKDLLRVLKVSASEERRASDPCDILQGYVLSASPLKIQISDKLILDDDFLVLPEHLTDHEVEIEIETAKKWTTESTGGGAGEAAFASHSHDIKGKRKMKILNALKKDDIVLLLRQDGGQNFIVLDRIGG